MHPVLQVAAVHCTDSTVIKFHQKNNIRNIEMERNDTHKIEKRNKMKSSNSQWNCHIPDQRSQTSTVAAVRRRHLQDGVQRLFSCISCQLLDQAAGLASQLSHHFLVPGGQSTASERAGNATTQVSLSVYHAAHPFICAYPKHYICGTEILSPKSKIPNYFQKHISKLSIPSHETAPPT